MDFTGKPMRGYVFVNAEAIESDTPLTFWLQHCLAFVQTLPISAPDKKTLMEMTPASYIGAAALLARGC